MSFRYSILFVFLVSIGYVSRGQSSRDVGVSAPKPVYQAHKVSNKRSVFFRKMFKKKELSEE
ncbi:MAG: hypothetical protein OEY56_04205, partial [Cyclobacteriaceae bacterium]|nr:hypothetical protein [Cyclobacteriaceae bacterium]